MIIRVVLITPGDGSVKFHWAQYRADSEEWNPVISPYAVNCVSSTMPSLFIKGSGHLYILHDTPVEKLLEIAGPEGAIDTLAYQQFKSVILNEDLQMIEIRGNYEQTK